MEKKLCWRVIAGVAVAGIFLATAVPTAAQAVDRSIERYYPLDGSTVEPGSVEFRGSIAQSGAESDGVNVVFAVDVSGSTSYPSAMDCNGNGVSNEFDDYNLDGSQGDVLDCEISAVAALSGELRTLENASTRVNVSIVPFGNSANAADMTPSGDKLVPPGFHNPDPENPGKDQLLSAVDVVATSLIRGGVRQYASYDVGQGTEFDAAVTTSLDLLASDSRDGWLFLLSDGQSYISDSVLERVRTDSVRTKVRSFAVGTGTGGCSPDDPLRLVAEASGDACVLVSDPTQLSSGITGSNPEFIDRVEVEYDGVSHPAIVDAIGNWTVTVPGVETGNRQATVRAFYTDGAAPSEDVWRFDVARSFQQVSLGDSYSSGEGVEPYLGQDGTSRDRDIRFLCHQSADGWPQKVLASQTADGDLDLMACSGAVIANLDSKKQEKTWRGSGVSLSNGLQLEHLTPDTDLVTVTIGGNDMGFEYVAKLCSGIGNCANSILPGTGLTLERWMQIRLALMHNDLNTTYSAIRQRVGPDAEVVAATYPRLWGTGDQNCVGGTKADRELMAKGVNTFASIAKVQAIKSGVLVADVRSRFDKGNGCVVAGLNPIIIGARATDLSGGLFVPSAASLHPDAKGVQFYADAVNEALTAASAMNATNARSSSSSAVSDASVPDAAQFEEVVVNPDEFLASVAIGEVDVVRATAFAEVVAGKFRADGFAGEQCDFVVANERVPVQSQGFLPFSEVKMKIATDGGEVATDWMAAADGDGVLRTEVITPAREPGTQLSVQLSGTSPDGGVVMGLTSLMTTSDELCEAQAETAGALVQANESTPSPTPVTMPDSVAPASSTPERQPATSSSVSRSLATTGVAPVTVALLVGVALALGVGVLLVAAAKRNRRNM